MRRRSLHGYIAAVVVVGVTAAVIVAWAGGNQRFDPVIVATYTLAMIVSLRLPVRYVRGDGTHALHVNDAVMLGLLFAAPPWLVLAVTALSSVAGNLYTRDARKISFNVGAATLATAVATAAFQAVDPGPQVLHPRSALAVIAASVAYNLVDVSLFGLLFSILDGRRVRATVREIRSVYAVSAVGNMFVGLLLGFIAMTDRTASVFVFVLVVGAHLGYRGYALAIEQHRENERRQSVARDLAAVMTSPDAVDVALSSLAELFSSPLVEMVVTSDFRSPRTHIHAPGTTTTAERLPIPDSPLGIAFHRATPVVGSVSTGGTVAADLRARGARSVIAVPLRYDGTTIGAIAVYDRAGVEGAYRHDLGSLTAVAHDVALALKNVELFSSVAHERALLEEQTRKLRDIVDAASDGIALLDPDGDVVAWNPAMSAMTGFSPADAIGRPWFMSLRMRDATGDEPEAEGPPPLRAALNGDRPDAPWDVQVLRRNGDWRWSRFTFSPVTRDGSGVVGVVVIARDVTREREAEELKSDFVATVSHELRTPLTPLKGFLLTIMQAGDRIAPTDLATFHESMLRQVERLEALVADLLVVAELDRDAIRVTPRPTDLVAVVRDAVAVERPITDGERIQLIVESDATAVGDDAIIRRIVRALVSNAIKHTDGPVTVRVGRDRAHASVAVHDRGPGIPLDQQRRIFARFARLGHHLTRQTQGSGLGLSIARELTERIGGQLQVDSAPGAGSTFTLKLPLAKPTSVPAIEPTRARA